MKDDETFIASALDDDPVVRQRARDLFQQRLDEQVSQDRKAAAVYDPWLPNVEAAVAVIQGLYDTWPGESWAASALSQTLRFLAEQIEVGPPGLPVPDALDLLCQRRSVHGGRQELDAENEDEER